MGAYWDTNSGVPNAGFCKGIKAAVITKIRHTLKEYNYDLDDSILLFDIIKQKLGI